MQANDACSVSAFLFQDIGTIDEVRLLRSMVSPDDILKDQDNGMEDVCCAMIQHLFNAKTGECFSHAR